MDINTDDDAMNDGQFEKPQTEENDPPPRAGDSSKDNAPINPFLLEEALKVPESSPNHKPWTSYLSLAPYFAMEPDVFKHNLKRTLGDIFEEAAANYESKDDYDSSKTVQLQSVLEILHQERDRGYGKITLPGDPDKYGNWTAVDWVAWFHHQTKFALFRDIESPFDGIAIPHNLWDDRARAVFLLMKSLRERRHSRTRPAASSAKGKAPVSDEYVYSSDEEEDDAGATTKPSTSGEPMTTSTPAASKSGTTKATKPKKIHKAAEVFKPSLKPHIRKKKLAVLTKKPKIPPPKTATNQERIKRVAALHCRYRAINTHASGMRNYQETIGFNELDKIEGNDVEENPLRHMFWRDEETGEVGLIGAHYLEGITRHQKVDWEDGGKIDTKNASSQFQKQWTARLRAEQAEGASATTTHAPSIVEEPLNDEQLARQGQRQFPTYQKATGKDLDDRAIQRTERRGVLMSLSQYDGEGLDNMLSMADTVAGAENVAQEVAAEGALAVPAKDLANDQSAEGGKSEEDAGGDAEEEADTTKAPSVKVNNRAFRQRQADILQATAPPRVEAETYRDSLSDIHVAKRSRPIIPGQTRGTLFWNQATSTRDMGTDAIRRREEQQGRIGSCLGDDTGLGKTISSISTIVHYINDLQLKMMEMRRNEDWEGLEKLPKPKAHFWVCPNHMIHQTMKDVQEFTNVLDVHFYGNAKKLKLRANVPVVPGTLDKDHIFFKDSALTNHKLIITTYGTLASRHGPKAVAAWRKAQTKCHTAQSKQWAAMNPNPPEFPMNLTGKVGMVVLDECQVAKNIDSNANKAIRYLNGVYHLLLTATPVPWFVGGFAGLLGLLHDPELSAEAQQRNIPNPYLASAPEWLHKYRSTLWAFTEYLTDDMSFSEQSAILRMVFKDVLIRRTYQSQCVTHPNGDVQTLRNLLPTCLPLRITVPNRHSNQACYDYLAPDFMKKLYTTEKSSDFARLNGRMVRILNLGSFCPLLMYARSMLEVKNNDFLTELSSLHDSGKYVEYLRRILVDVAESAAEYNVHDLIPDLPADGKVWPVNKDTVGLIVNAFASRSERIRLLLATLRKWVVDEEQKVLVFCMNPTEQEILDCILNAVGIQSRANLSRYDASARQDFIDKFNSPPVAWNALRDPEQQEKEVEVLLNSVNQNTGINYQEFCSHMILTGPPTSHPVWLQCIGRIVRIGQKHACTAVELYDPNTYNSAVVRSNTKRALPALGAYLDADKLNEMFGIATDEDGNDVEGEDVKIDLRKMTGFVIIDGELMHKSAPEFPQEYADATELKPDDVLLQLFLMSRSKEVRYERREDGGVVFANTGAPIATVYDKATSTPIKNPATQGQRTHTGTQLNRLRTGVDINDARYDNGLAFPLEHDAAEDAVMPESIQKKFDDREDRREALERRRAAGHVLRLDSELPMSSPPGMEASPTARRMGSIREFRHQQEERARRTATAAGLVNQSRTMDQDDRAASREAYNAQFTGMRRTRVPVPGAHKDSPVAISSSHESSTDPSSSSSSGGADSGQEEEDELDVDQDVVPRDDVEPGMTGSRLSSPGESFVSEDSAHDSDGQEMDIDEVFINAHISEAEDEKDGDYTEGSPAKKRKTVKGPATKSGKKKSRGVSKK